MVQCVEDAEWEIVKEKNISVNVGHGVMCNGLWLQTMVVL